MADAKKLWLKLFERPCFGDFNCYTHAFRYKYLFRDEEARYKFARECPYFEKCKRERQRRWNKWLRS